MKKLITLTFFALFVFGANAQELIIIHSDNLKCDDSIRVYSPQNCTACNHDQCVESLPTLFLLHGWSGDYKNWGDKSDLQKLCNETGFRIICPDGFYNSWYADNVNKAEMQWKTFFDEELYPQMAEKYKLDPAKTFITGLSMGGLGALNIFIDNPDRFAAAGSMSGVLNIHHTTLIESQVTKVLGPYTPDSQIYNDYSVVHRLDKMVGNSKIMIATCGYDDYYAKSTIEFEQKCKELKIPHITILSPGTHSWKYWDFALGMHIGLFTKIMNGDNLGY